MLEFIYEAIVFCVQVVIASIIMGLVISGAALVGFLCIDYFFY